MSGLTWWNSERPNRTDRFYWKGENGKDLPVAFIYSIGREGGPVEIEATYRGFGKTFPRNAAGLAAAKEWCEAMLVTEELEDRRKAESLADDGFDMGMEE